MADFCTLAQMCYAGRGTTAITDRSNQRSDPSHLKSLPEKSKPMLRVDLKAKISMAQWNGMNSFLNIKWTYFSWAQLLWLYEISDVITNKMLKSRKIWLPCMYCNLFLLIAKKLDWVWNACQNLNLYLVSQTQQH